MASTTPSTTRNTAAHKRIHPSLTQRLILWTLGALIVVWATFVAIAYRIGIEEADELTDGHLASVASLIANLHTNASPSENSAPQPQPKPKPLPRKTHDYQQTISVFEWDANERLLVHSGSATTPPQGIPQGFAILQLNQQHIWTQHARPTFFTPSSGANHGTYWRSFTQKNPVNLHKIMVLIELRERDALAQDIAKQMIIPGMWLLPVVALALGLTLRRGLRPLDELSNDVEQLHTHSTPRLSSRHPWQEFESVVASINTLLDRQTHALARERQLAHEIAHELRTPLTSITLQARALEDEAAPEQQKPLLQRIRQDALRASHVLNQLLALAKTSRAAQHDSPIPFNIGQLVRDTCADYAQSAWRQHKTIAVIGEDSQILQGHPVLIDIALRNLIENALKHTPSNTQIAIEFEHHQNQNTLELCVSDDGARPAHATQPAPAAPNVANNHTDNLHLGHLIVSRVAEAHQGHFQAIAAKAPYTTCYRITFRISSSLPHAL